MSFNDLPEKSAPLAERLKAAMAQSDYRTQRSLAKALGTDGSVVGKWLNGKTLEIKSIAHRSTLARLLNTPEGYFSDPSRADRLAELEAEVADLTTALVAARQVDETLRRRLAKLEKAVQPLLQAGAPGKQSTRRAQSAR